MTNDQRCKLCGGAKHPVNYSAAESAGGPNPWRTVWVCRRCDLSPDPPHTYA